MPAQFAAKELNSVLRNMQKSTLSLKHEHASKLSKYKC